MHSFPCSNEDCLSCMMEDMNRTVAANGGTLYADEKTAPVATRNKPAGQRSGRGYVRTISEKQKGFILSLLSKKDITNLTILPGQTINPDEIGNMGVKGGTALIEKLLNCPNKPLHSVSIVNQGSPKQQSFLKSLMAQLNLTESDINNRSYASVSDAISELLKETKSMPKVMVKKESITEGMYKVGERIFKVQRSKTSGNLYAKELNGNSFEYAQGAMRIIKAEHRMTLEEAKAYGKATGQCCVCGRELTNEESITNGIGPVCSSKF